LDKVLAGLSYNKWRAEVQHPLTNLIYCNVQEREAGDSTSICSSPHYFFFFAQISYIPEKSHSFPNEYQCAPISQRPPPFIEN
jgi:hypothetical protein